MHVLLDVTERLITENSSEEDVEKLWKTLYRPTSDDLRGFSEQESADSMDAFEQAMGGSS